MEIFTVLALVSGVYLVILSFATETAGFINVAAFKIIPFALGLCLILFGQHIIFGG